MKPISVANISDEGLAPKILDSYFSTAVKFLGPSKSTFRVLTQAQGHTFSVMAIFFYIDFSLNNQYSKIDPWKNE